MSADAPPKVSGGLTKKSSCLWRFLFTVCSLHPSCSLLSLCQNFWQRTDPPTSSVPPLLSSPAVSLSVFLFPALILCQLQLVWQIRSRGCHGNPSYPYRLMDHLWIVLLPSQLPRKIHTPNVHSRTGRSPLSPLSPPTLSTSFILLNCNHNILFPFLPPSLQLHLSQPGQDADIISVS